MENCKSGVVLVGVGSLYLSHFRGISAFASFSIAIRVVVSAWSSIVPSKILMQAIHFNNFSWVFLILFSCAFPSVLFFVQRWNCILTSTFRNCFMFNNNVQVRSVIQLYTPSVCFKIWTLPVWSCCLAAKQRCIANGWVSILLPKVHNK